MKKIDQILSTQKTIYAFTKKIEAFFEQQNFTFIQTPLLTTSPIPESSIPLFSTIYNLFDEKQQLYLLPSPELYLKSLIAEGAKNIYTISKAFRNGEALEGRHNIEFTMLEYYIDNATYLDNLCFTKKLLCHLFEKTIECKTITIEEAFCKWAGFSLKKALQENNLRLKARSCNFSILEDWSDQDIFNYIMVDKIESSLPKDCFCFLIDYPSLVFTTGKQTQDGLFTQRWELYFNNIEIANCYSEIDNQEDLITYYKHELDIINGNNKLSPNQEKYCTLFKTFPTCSGCALGIERLLMAYLNTSQINSLLLFPNKQPFLT